MLALPCSSSIPQDTEEIFHHRPQEQWVLSHFVLKIINLDVLHFSQVALISSVPLGLQLLYNISSSAHGSFIGSIRLDPNTPHQLQLDQTIHFGASSRTYTLRYHSFLNLQFMLRCYPIHATSGGNRAVLVLN